MTRKQLETTIYDGLRFDYDDLIKSVRWTKILASNFLQPDAEQILSQLASDIGSARSGKPGQDHTIGILRKTPLKTITSSSYDRSNVLVYGELSFIWNIRNPNKGARTQKFFNLVGKASSNIDLKATIEGKESTVARWQMEVGDAGSPGCHFHSAVNLGKQEGVFPDWLGVPRLPGLLVWPMDILDFMLGELFQSKWHEHLSRKGAVTATVGKGQMERLSRVLKWQEDKVRDFNTTPWMTLKKAKPGRDLFVSD